MSAETLEQLQQRKKAIREEAHARRNALEGKDEKSRLICEKLVALPEYQRAKTVMWYVDARSEVRTRHFLPIALQGSQRIVVPYCVNGELERFLLQTMDELALGMYRILEPRTELRDLPEKKVPVDELDMIVVPGVAFDRQGGRMGHGFGYYDKLLQYARPGVPFIALAFECQLFESIPTQAHDIYMDKILTEQATYEGKGRQR